MFSLPISQSTKHTEGTVAIPNYAFFEGKIVPIEEAKVSVVTHALHYGTGCFGGFRAYWNDDDEQLYVFRLTDHIQRFLSSTKLLLMNLPYSPEHLRGIVLELLRCEGFRSDTYVAAGLQSRSEDRRLAARYERRTHDLRHPFGRYIDNEEGTSGVLIWRRIDDNAIPARGKIAGAYVNFRLSSSPRQLTDGYDEALVLDQHGHVAEAAAENIFIVRDGEAITPPVTANILEGITRRT